MTVKEIICEALRLVGRDDAADALTGDGTPDSEQTRIKNAFLTYYNSVTDELARGYFPLDYEEEFTATEGKVAFSSFAQRPVRIRRVSSGGKPVRWHLSAKYLYTEGVNIKVYYSYAPATAAETDEFDYPVYAVGKDLVECGMIAEHYLVCGNAESSKVWEEKYHDGIEALLSAYPLRERIPPRRWI